MSRNPRDRVRLVISLDSADPDDAAVLAAWRDLSPRRRQLLARAALRAAFLPQERDAALAAAVARLAAGVEALAAGGGSWTAAPASPSEPDPPPDAEAAIAAEQEELLAHILAAFPPPAPDAQAVGA